MISTFSIEFWTLLWIPDVKSSKLRKQPHMITARKRYTSCTLSASGGDRWIPNISNIPRFYSWYNSIFHISIYRYISVSLSCFTLFIRIEFRAWTNCFTPSWPYAGYGLLTAFLCYAAVQPQLPPLTTIKHLLTIVPANHTCTLQIVWLVVCWHLAPKIFGRWRSSRQIWE